MQHTTHWLWFTVVVLIGCATLQVADAASMRQLVARSTPHTVALLELYTSEGCNSCPPADQWVSSLPRQGFRPDQVVPLALHVDYWDYLGWPDRFAHAMFTTRQRAMATLHRSRTIYTPQILLQGKDFRSWRSIQAEVERINRTTAQANITLHVTQEQPTALKVMAQVSVPEAAARQDAALYVALYENQLQSVVTAGENSGHTLHHDFVVRQWFGPQTLDAQGMLAFQRHLHLDTTWKAQDLGLAAFVQNHRTGEVLQALALPLGQ